MEDRNELFEDLAGLKKFIRMKMHAHVSMPKMKRIRRIISEMKDDVVLKG